MEKREAITDDPVGPGKWRWGPHVLSSEGVLIREDHGR